MAANPHATARAAGTVSVLALLSPLAGLAVELALAWRFGASDTVDAFRIGALLLLFGQQLFVQQILPHALVPVFSEYRALGQEQQGWRVAQSLANLLVYPAALVALLFVLHPRPLIELLAPGLTGEARAAATLFLRCFLPACALMVWSGVATGVLYAYRIFWLPPAVQLAGNIVMVVLILALGRTLGPSSLILGVWLATLLGLALYLAQLAPLMRQAGARFTWSFEWKHPGVRKALGLALPLLGTFLLSQWIAVVVNRAVSVLPPGNLATFGYAWKLGQLAFLAPLSLAIVLFPRFADARVSSSEAEFRDLCTRALRMALFVTVPPTCLVYALRSPLVALLFERGAFNAEATQAVSQLFGLTLLGTPAAVIAVYLDKIFYARQQMWVPTWARGISAVLLAALAPPFAARLEAEGVALLLSALSCLTVAVLFSVLAYRARVFCFRKLASFAAYVLALAVATTWLGVHAGLVLGRVAKLPSFPLELTTAAGMAVGALLFFAVSLGFEVPEARECSRYLRWRTATMFRRHDAARG